MLPDGPYETVAGFMVQQLGHVPVLEETVTFDDYRLTVVDVDGRRISRVKVAALPTGSTDGPAADPAEAAEPKPGA